MNMFGSMTARAQAHASQRKQMELRKMLENVAAFHKLRDNHAEIERRIDESNEAWRRVIAREAEALKAGTPDA